MDMGIPHIRAPLCFAQLALGIGAIIPLAYAF
jgi:hypothetical protein